MKLRLLYRFVFLVLVSCGEDSATPNGNSGAGTAGTSASSGAGGTSSVSGGTSSASGGAASGSGGTSSGGESGKAPVGGSSGGSATSDGGSSADGDSSSGGRADTAGSAGTAGGGAASVAPTLNSIDPSTLPLGSDSFQLVLHGKDFRSDHHVSFDGNLFATTFVSAEELRAEVPGVALGSRARTVNVLALRVSDPALRSNALPFEITAAP